MQAVKKEVNKEKKDDSEQSTKVIHTPGPAKDDTTNNNQSANNTDFTADDFTNNRFLEVTTDDVTTGEVEEVDVELENFLKEDEWDGNVQVE